MPLSVQQCGQRDMHQAPSGSEHFGLRRCDSAVVNHRLHRRLDELLLGLGLQRVQCSPAAVECLLPAEAARAAGVAAPPYRRLSAP
jgi:hypothetical protein